MNGSIQNRPFCLPAIDHLDIWTSAWEKKASGGRGRNGKLSPYGIQKLRELILELAVRGRLVPQDPNDEPASVLLEKIAEEKARLVKEGEIRKPKKLPEVTEKEKPFDLPEGWDWVRLGDFVYIEMGQSPSSKYYNQEQKGMPFFQGKADFGDIYPTPRYWCTQPSKLAYNGDVLLSVRAPVGPTNICNIDCTIGRGLAALRPMARVGSKFVLFEMRAFQNKLQESATGTTFSAVSKGVVELLPVVVPPLAEQHRIVTKVDELMALCDRLEQEQTDSLEAHQTLVETLLRTLTEAPDAETAQQAWQRIAQHFDLLFTTETAIDQLKQTILQLAVMGKLVPQNPNDEPVSELLNRVEEQTNSSGNKAKRSTKKTTAIPWIEKDLPAIPKEWSWIQLGKLVTMMDAGWSPACPAVPSPNEEVWGVLKTTAVQVMKYVQQENKRLPDTKQPKPQYEVRAGDILITRAGPKNRVAISCLVEETRPKLMISDKIIRFHLVEIGVYERYISLCLNAGATADYLETAKSGMAESQMNISQDKLKMAPIPLCPTAEQHRIVAKVDELMALCDALKARVQQAETTQRHIADAVVAQAASN